MADPKKKKYKTVDEALFYANQKQGLTQPNAGIDGTTFPRDKPTTLNKEKGNPEDTMNKMYGFKGPAGPNRTITEPMSSKSRATVQSDLINKLQIKKKKQAI